MKRQGGFTVPELLVVMITTTIFISVIMVFTFNYWRYGYSIQTDLDSFVERLNASDYLRESLGTSSGLITQNSLPDNNPGVVDNTITPAKYWIPNHAIPGNKTYAADPATITPLLYYKRYATNTSKQIVMNGSQPYEDEYILYLDKPSRSLRVRTLANSAVANNYAKTTCPPGETSDSCPADTTLITNIDSIDIRFFSKSGNLLDWQSKYDSFLGTYTGPDNPVVEVVELKMNVLAKARFQKVANTKNSTIVRVALRNT